MNRSIPPRLRAPAIFLIVVLIALVIGAATHGTKTLIYIVPIPVVVVTALYVSSRRDSDTGAVIRHQLDERLAHQRLKVQALVGRVLNLAVAVAYIVASASHTALWPWATLLGLTLVAFLIGWLLYGEHGARRSTDQAG